MDHVLNCSGYETVRTDVVRGEGCTLYDATGKGYVDFEAGVWCASLGHGHPRVVDAALGQARRVAHLGYRYTNAVVEEAAAEVLTAAGLPGGKCLFMSSGSEAVEFAVQAARHLSGRPLLLTLEGTYLAAYGSSGRLSRAEWHRLGWSACATCESRELCAPGCPLLREIPLEQVGAFVFEPGNASGVVKLPPAGLVRSLAARVWASGGLVVVDEVTTGLGRTGAWQGYQHYGLRPDLVALGKGLGSGYPVSAVAMTPAVGEALERSDFHYAQSHQNDPLGCAVAREVVTVIREEDLVERAARVGAAFLSGLHEIARRHACVREVRGRGLMIVMEMGTPDGAMDGGAAVSSAYRSLLAEGFMAGCKPSASILRFYPPLIIPEHDVARLLECLDRILTDRASRPQLMSR